MPHILDTHRPEKRAELERVGRIPHREAPRGILEQLREIDAAAGLIYGGDGHWVLGVWNGNGLVTLEGHKRLVLEMRKPVAKRHAGRIRVNEAIAKGFRIVAIYEVLDDDFGPIVDDFRKADHAWRQKGAKAFEDREEEADVHYGYLEERKRQMREYVQAEAASIWRYTIGKARSFLMPRRA